MSVLLSLLLAAHHPNKTLEISQVYAVSNDVIALEIETGQVIHGEQIPYLAQSDDTLVEEEAGHRIERQGRTIGTLIRGALLKSPLLYTFDQLVGSSLDLTWASQANHYRISSSTDPDYQVALSPSDIFRKSKPIDMASLADGQAGWVLKHTLYLKLSKPLEVGQTYDLDFPESPFEAIQFEYQPQQRHSEAVHISQIGFRPDDSLKVGYLSTWMGEGEGYDYPEGLTFWVRNTVTGEIAYTGQAKQRRPLNQSEDPRGRDYTLTEVHELDFSHLTATGQYQLCVETVGCSFSFAIDEAVWQQAFSLSARGFYHQRSGIALGTPYTAYQRPRAFHPEDGVVVYQSQAKLMDTDMGLGHEDAFRALVQSKTETVLPDAWGGYFDAGDWDRRIQHLAVSRSLLELLELFPNYFATVNLNIPESTNSLPDTLDEALWGLDFFYRLQTSDGGIRGGVESAAHPQWGEASWQESLTVMAYAPDMWSSYLYAGVAARAAYVLAQLDPALARRYRESALRAMTFAEEAHAEALSQGDSLHHAIRDERNLAALELFRLTGDDGWHSLFLDTTIFQDAAADVYLYGQQNQRDAAFLYARLSDLHIDHQVQNNALNAQIREADILMDVANSTGFGWSKTHPWEALAWGDSIGAPKAIALARGHALTGQEQYLSAMLRATQYSLGANPDNMTYTTGLGHRSPKNPLLIDQRILGVEPPPGITVHGPLDFVEDPDYWTAHLLKPVTYPDLGAWPTAEGYFDIYPFPASTEFTVMLLTLPTYTWGYLAAREPLNNTSRIVPMIELPAPL